MTDYDWSVLDRYVRHMMDVYKVPGLSLGIAQAGKVLHNRGYGFRDREQKLEATPETVYGIGSCTKSFTAVAVLQLEEQDKISVTDPITKYLPEWKLGKDDHKLPITIHHLLTHSAGLPVLPTLFPAMLKSMRADPSVKKCPEGEPVETDEEFFNYVGNLDIEPLGAPGTYFSYSNDSWAMLGTIISRVSGKPYEQYIMDHIVRPMTMEKTLFALDEAGGIELTELYSTNSDAKDEVVHAPGWWEAPAMSAAGFIRSNVNDMLRYMEIYRQNGTVDGARILSPSSIERMTTPYMWRGGNSHYGYGLGVNVNYHGVSLVEHSGGIKGVSAHIIYVPERGITGVALANLGGIPSGQILLGAVNLLLGLPVDSRRENYADYACPPERLPKYAGTYVSPEAGAIRVSVEGGRLLVEVSGDKVPARPIGVNMFSIKQKEMESAAHFLIDPNGEVWAVQFGARVIRKTRS